MRGKTKSSIKSSESKETATPIVEERVFCEPVNSKISDIFFEGSLIKFVNGKAYVKKETLELLKKDGLVKEI